jgi:hypothetical protein
LDERRDFTRDDAQTDMLGRGVDGALEVVGVLRSV